VDQKNNKILKSLHPSFAEIYLITRKVSNGNKSASIFIWIDKCIIIDLNKYSVLGGGGFGWLRIRINRATIDEHAPTLLTFFYQVNDF
jgi:hypothetical protein